LGKKTETKPLITLIKCDRKHAHKSEPQSQNETINYIKENEQTHIKKHIKKRARGSVYKCQIKARAKTKTIEKKQCALLYIWHKERNKENKKKKIREGEEINGGR